MALTHQRPHIACETNGHLPVNKAPSGHDPGKCLLSKTLLITTELMCTVVRLQAHTQVLAHELLLVPRAGEDSPPSRTAGLRGSDRRSRQNSSREHRTAAATARPWGATANTCRSAKGLGNVFKNTVLKKIGLPHMDTTIKRVSVNGPVSWKT